MKSQPRQPLGQLLISRGALISSMLDQALDIQRRSNPRQLLGEILVAEHLCSDAQVAEALADADGLPFAAVNPKLADPKVVGILPREFMLEHGVLPLFLVQDILTVAMSEPSNVFLVDEIERRSGHRVQIVAATHAAIRATLDAYLHDEKVFVVDRLATTPTGNRVKMLDQAAVHSAPVSGQSTAVEKLVEYCIDNAIEESAAEVHIEPSADELRIRFRIDGRLIEKLHPPGRFHAPLIARLKQFARLDVNNTALPQDGRFRLGVESRTITLIVTTIPGRFGEKMVLRVANEDLPPTKLEKLGFSYDMLKQWRRLINLPSGLVIIAGPSGSGKRATLYATLAERNSSESNLCTVEDRVEQTLAGINQFEVNLATGFAFPAMVRAVLKQEPDVLMIADLPDVQTARAAAQAALSGRLVFAGMYATDTPGALSRLLHIGVEPHLLGATVAGVLSRRLVRRLCSHCREPYEATSAQRRQIESISPGPATLYRPRGCDHCKTTGYTGRIGVHELLTLNDQMSDRLSQGATLPELRKLAADAGMKPLKADAIEKARAGLTTLDEVFRVTT